MKAQIVLWIVYVIGVMISCYYAWGKLTLHQGIKISLVVLVILLPILIMYLRKKKDTGPKAQIGDGKVEIFFFYTQWCPYCRKSRPAWDEFKHQWEGKAYNGHELFFTEIDCDRQEAIANQYQVNDYPTIKLLKGNDIIEFDAKPTVDSLNQFLSSCLDSP